VQLAYIVEVLYPKINEIRISTRKLSVLQQEEIIQKLGKRSLRELAKECNVSYETVRRIGQEKHLLNP
jgi:DNA-directed RNA polymerase specialized sigma24 family protein